MQKLSGREHRIDLDGVVIVFSWCGDRWSHAIHFRGSGNTAAWRSVEGHDGAGGDTAWPVSPVIVELSPVPAAAAIVGVGRAGKSHYSVSFTAKPAGSSTAGRASQLFVECACRIHEPPGWIGSTYERAAAAGQTAGRVRIAAAIDPATVARLPRTVTWSYVFGPEGPVPGLPKG